MKPRPYQIESIRRVRESLGRNPILVQPTGAGKTFTAAELVKELGVPTLWIAHRRELITQAAHRLARCGLRVGVIAAGYNETRGAQVHVASIQTLVRRSLPTVGLIVIDEAHHARASQYRKVLDAMPGVPFIGLTATPFRLDGKGLGDVGFGEIIVGAWPDELVAEGMLVEPVVYAPEIPDLARVKLHHGDYSEKDLGDELDKPTLVGNIVDTWRKLAHGRRTVAFAVNVAHSRHIVESFRAVGVKAEHLDGSMSRSVRDGILHRLSIGYTTLVSQCMVLSEGWDLPALEVAILARPTRSLNMHLQQIGRVARAAPDKTGALILDHAGNHIWHGTMMQRVLYSLDDVATPASKRKGEQVPAAKRCPACYLLVTPATTVCACGYKFESKAKEIKTADGELKEFNAPPSRSSVPFLEQRQAWEAIRQRQLHWEYSLGWSKLQFRSKFGWWPVLVGERLIDPSVATVTDAMARLCELMETRARKGFKPGFPKVQFHLEFRRWPTAKEWAAAEAECARRVARKDQDQA